MPWGVKSRPSLARVRVSVEPDADELLRAAAPEVAVDPALDDAEHLLTLGVRLGLRARGPADRLLDGLLGAPALAGVRQAFVEDHRDVGPDRALHRHRFLGSEEELVAVDVRVEAASVLGDLAHPGEREDLESA